MYEKIVGIVCIHNIFIEDNFMTNFVECIE